MAALLVFIVFLVGIAVSIPIGISMILGSAAPIFLMDKGGSIVQILNNTFSGANSTPILAVPLFILGGVIMAEGGISKKLFSFFAYFVGRLPGGVPCAVILTCLICNKTGHNRTDNQRADSNQSGVQYAHRWHG